MAHRFAFEITYGPIPESDILHIRESKESSRSLASHFGVCEQTVASVRKGRTWKNLDRFLS